MTSEKVKCTEENTYKCIQIYVNLKYFFTFISFVVSFVSMPIPQYMWKDNRTAFISCLFLSFHHVGSRN